MSKRTEFLILGTLVLIVLNIGFIDSTYGHKAKVLSDFKIDVGWKNEPVIVKEENAIEIIIELASEYDKQKYDQIVGDVIGESYLPVSKEDIMGLASNLTVVVKLADNKTTLHLVEDSERTGIYHGKYTPKEVGQTTVNIFGVIKNIEFEATFRPEKVQPQQAQDEKSSFDADSIKQEIPVWVKDTAGWWADDQITDGDFIQSIQYLIKEGIIIISIESSENDRNMINTEEIPVWVKDTAGWWADDQITDGDFIQSIQYLIINNIIKI